MHMPSPSLAEVKAAGQPPGITSRLNDEHWAGRYYMRRVSPGATWIFARLGWPPNAVTAGFIACGLAAGAVVALGGLAGAIAAAVLVQGYLLLDCADGELARWSGRTSAAGVYLDGIGHYVGEAALLAGLGIRAQGHLALSGGYVSAGLAAAVLAALVKAETDNVAVARAKTGLPATHGDAALAPRGAGLARARRIAAALKVHRAIHAVELSLLVLAAAITDAVRGGLSATRVLVIACLIIAGLMVPAHLAAILASRRLK
jgi:phosphatidylglycerophosphate synthase